MELFCPHKHNQSHFTFYVLSSWVWKERRKPSWIHPELTHCRPFVPNRSKAIRSDPQCKEPEHSNHAEVNYIQMLENYVFYHHWYIFYNNNFSSRIIAAFNTFADTWFDEKQSVMRQSTKSTQHPAHSLTECEAVWWCCCFESFWGLLQWDITTSWTYCTLNTVTPLGHQRGTIATSLILRLIRLYSISASKCLTSHQSSCARFPEQQKKTQHTEEG